MQVVGAPARMGIQCEKSGLLALQRVEAINERQVFGDIREIPGVVDVLVVHARALCTARSVPARY